MEIRLLRSFLVLAQELHFGRAAERLHIAQPPLTKQIHQLERDLGVQLFERHSRGVRLTHAGQAFIEPARKVLEAADYASAAAQRASDGETGTVTIGFSGALGGAVLPRMIRTVHQHHPNIEIRIRRQSYSSIVLDRVVDGDLDLGIIILPVQRAGISTLPIMEHTLVAVLPKDHRLAAEEDVTFEALRDENFVVPEAYQGSVMRDLLVSRCVDAGFNPRIVQEAEDTYTILSLVGGGVGVSVSLSGVQNLHPDSVVFKPLRDSTDTVLTALGWRTDKVSRTLSRVMETLNAEFAPVSAGSREPEMP
jgi:DNA-binding transcriptional LysR family regulator